ncbi:hypothetical protein QBC35DRAFT_479604 [Podospora australis]|uniref:Uncharacterized protein n=1 Tax=Podospora australis TaxID=1536484 RepID=A0AAN6X946_9PEZI|nr:hypothetical protein QBC35DRAFT_479604 [Podospora australis]
MVQNVSSWIWSLVPLLLVDFSLTPPFLGKAWLTKARPKRDSDYWTLGSTGAAPTQAFCKTAALRIPSTWSAVRGHSVLPLRHIGSRFRRCGFCWKRILASTGDIKPCACWCCWEDAVGKRLG